MQSGRRGFFGVVFGGAAAASLSAYGAPNPKDQQRYGSESSAHVHYHVGARDADLRCSSRISQALAEAVTVADGLANSINRDIDRLRGSI